MKEDLETVVDRLLDYVKANGKVSSSAAAQALGLKREQVERLAQILEENGLLEVRYGISDTVFSEKKPPKPPAKPPVPDKIMADSKVLGDEASTTGNLTAFFEHDIGRRIQRAESMLDAIERSQEFTQEELDEVKRELDLAISQLARFSDEIKRVQEAEARFYEKLYKFKTVLAGISPSEKPKARGPLDSFFGGFSLPWQKKAKPAGEAPVEAAEPAVGDSGSSDVELPAEDGPAGQEKGAARKKPVRKVRK